MAFIYITHSHNFTLDEIKPKRLDLPLGMKDPHVSVSWLGPRQSCPAKGRLHDLTLWVSPLPQDVEQACQDCQVPQLPGTKKFRSFSKK